MVIFKEQLAQRLQQLHLDLRINLQEIEALEARLQVGGNAQLELQLDEKTDCSARIRGGINILEEMIENIDD